MHQQASNTASPHGLPQAEARERLHAATGWVIAGAFAFLLLALYLPLLRAAFHFAPVTPWQLMLSLAAGPGSVLWFELHKLIRR